MILNELYQYADVSGIDIDCYDLKASDCMTFTEDGEYFIAFNPIKLKSTADEKVKLAHELGHCVTHSFYNEYSPFDIRAKHERRADKWAIKKLIPKDELKEACKHCVNRYELSEHFGVTEDFMQKALDYYSKQIIQQEYGCIINFLSR